MIDVGARFVGTYARLESAADGIVAVSIHPAPAGAATRIPLRPERTRREVAEAGRALGSALVRGLSTWVFLR